MGGVRLHHSLAAKNTPKATAKPISKTACSKSARMRATIAKAKGKTCLMSLRKAVWTSTSWEVVLPTNTVSPEIESSAVEESVVRVDRSGRPTGACLGVGQARVSCRHGALLKDRSRSPEPPRSLPAK
jgi:hypothetical protein